MSALVYTPVQVADSEKAKSIAREMLVDPNTKIDGAARVLLYAWAYNLCSISEPA